MDGKKNEYAFKSFGKRIAEENKRARFHGTFSVFFSLICFND